MTTSPADLSKTAFACTPDSAGHCITCSDEALEAVVLRVDQATSMALVVVAGETLEVDISLVEPPVQGDRLLIHGGVAIATV